MESNQNNFAAWIASGERCSYFSAQAQSAMTCESRRFDSVGCCAIRFRSFRVHDFDRPARIFKRFMTMDDVSGDSDGTKFPLDLNWDTNTQTGRHRGVVQTNPVRCASRQKSSCSIRAHDPSSVARLVARDPEFRTQRCQPADRRRRRQSLAGSRVSSSVITTCWPASALTRRPKPCNTMHGGNGTGSQHTAVTRLISQQLPHSCSVSTKPS